MADTLISAFHDKIRTVALLPSKGGVFEIVVNDERIFSKKELGRFPEDGEIEAALKAR